MAGAKRPKVHLMLKWHVRSRDRSTSENIIFCFAHGELKFGFCWEAEESRGLNDGINNSL